MFGRDGPFDTIFFSYCLSMIPTWPGALEAAMEAKEAGKIRYIGFTGHKSPAIHLKMLETAKDHGFQFDAVQMPLPSLSASAEQVKKLSPAPATSFGLELNAGSRSVFISPPCSP